MSKKESNFMPVGTVRPPAPITTDNSAVIATLEKRVEELEAQLKAERAAVWKLIDESRQQQAHIAELEKVAEAAEATYKIFFWDGTKPLSHWEREYNALRAAGYLGGGG